MTAAILNVVLGVVVTVAVLAVLLHAIRRTRREPRRLSNAFWLLIGGFLTVQVSASFGVPGAGFVVGLLAVLLVSAPLLIDVVAVFLIINGFTILRKESRSLGNALSLLAGLGLLALSLTPLLALVGSPPAVLVVLVFVAMLVAYVGFVFAGFLFYSWLYPKITGKRPVAWVVVLGSGLIDGYVVPPLLAGRIAAGQREFARRQARLLIMSGGKGDDEQLPEAEAMAAWALERGADPTTLRIENRSATTEQNLRFTAELLAAEEPAAEDPNRPLADASPPSWPEVVIGSRRSALPVALDRLLGGPIDASTSQGLIVTSNYHVLRAAILARQLGVPAQAAGAPTARYYWPSAMLREFVALLVNRWRLYLLLGSLAALPVPVTLLVVAVSGI